MSKLIDTLKTNQSAFRHTVISAIVLGVGSILGITVDLGWLIGDMLVATHPHHWFVLVGLIVADTLSIVAMYYLYKGVNTYTVNHDKKVKAKKNSTRKVSKQSEVIIHLSKRIDELETKLGDK